jgi:circadian clock protein KaiB
MSDSSSTAPKLQEDTSIYQFLLFVAGKEANSTLARQNLEAFCHAELKDGYELQVVDVFKDHRLALQHRVLVTPCLVMVAPLPSVMIAGTLRDEEKLRTALRVPKE